MKRLLTAVLLLVVTTVAQAAELRAIVAKRVIYPGETLTAADLRDVAVRNPRPVSAPVVRRMSDAVGLVTKKTLLPKRYIRKSSLRRPFLVQAGKPVRITYSNSSLNISIVGAALEAGELGSVVAVRNTSSGKRLFGVVEADGSVRVQAQ
ncbi:MAG: flagellar basal body P-ring formation chaperone FlgA [Ahrensia sp.]|nr:flagellar basal body P-ring formation chaperone FlgA [Ahrensia sp.]